MPNSEPWLSVADAAIHLGVQPDTIYKWISRSSLPAHKAGRLWKFRKSELDDWVMHTDPSKASTRTSHETPKARNNKEDK